MMNKNSKRHINVAELFCGAGGMALGAKLAKHYKYKLRHTWAIDNDKNSCLTFKENFSEAEIICKDITDAKFERIPAIHGLLFGFPCNDFSQVGEKKGVNGKYGGLYSYCVKALKQKTPLFFVAENVGGLRSSNRNKDYEHILDELRQCGYIISPQMYHFEKYAVPQKRHRIIIVGFREDANFSFNHGSPPNKYITAGKALSNIPENASNHEKTAQSSRVTKRLEHILPGQNAFNADIPDDLKLNIGNVKMSMIYRKLKPDEPSYTITGSGGGGTHVYHWNEHRSLTNRERARLQTFPDKFKFLGGKESVRRQIGMAVPPDGIKIVFERILQAIDKNGLHEFL